MKSLGLKHLISLFLFSGVLTVLYLVGPIFMMQVYDRVLPSGNLATLVGLGIIALLLYALFGIIDYFKGQLFLNEGEAFAERLQGEAYRQSLEGFAFEGSSSDKRKQIDDVSSVRSALTSPGFAALFDLFWMPIFLIFVFMIHWSIGVISLVAGVLLTALAIFNERSTREAVRQESERRFRAMSWSQQTQRQSSYIFASGMFSAAWQKWQSLETEARLHASKTAETSAAFTTATKTIRLIIQSSILGVGAFLAVKGAISPGSMIAASIVFSRTLAPIEQILGGFPNLLRGKEAWGRLVSQEAENEGEKLQLPDPTQTVAVAIQELCPPGYDDPILKMVKFDLKAGDVLGVIGPSGSGKSSLSKALTGTWSPRKGVVKLDGAALKDWPEAQIGKCVGYLPQEIELFDGTISENIAGFDPNANSEDILEAANLAGAGKLILSLPDGYNTVVGMNGVMLSAGQKQRVALARALYGAPFMVVMDEPNSNLDAQGEAALAAAIRKLKANGKVVVVVAHRERVLSETNKLCVIESGAMKMFGPRDAVQRRLEEDERKGAQPSPQQGKQAGSLKNARPRQMGGRSG